MLNNNSGLKTNFRVGRTIVVHNEKASSFGTLSQDHFLRMLCLERKRMERSGHRFVLMLVDPGRLLKTGNQKDQFLSKLLSTVAGCIRDTDIIGWYKEGLVVGVIFTEVGNSEDKAVVRALSAKVTDALYTALTIEQTNEIQLSFHVFPDDWDDDNPDGPVTSTLRVLLAQDATKPNLALQIKRLVDIVGSLTAIVFCLPVFLLIALAIKLTSKGPVLFRQVRLGQHGKKFTFLKFRSMYVNNDSSIHEEYVKRLIAGSSDVEHTGEGQKKLYKLTADPRVTFVGRILRQTSLDELPQFLNVLKGEMSLVGPRPPVCYEYVRYDLWHKRRLSAVKPGITGLWQVDGRSRVKFDDMVRMDIRYARAWSLWLDLKILLRTPRAVLSGDGAC